MRSFHARGVVLALGLALAAGSARGNDPLGQPSLLPLPPVEYPASQVGHRSVLWNADEAAAAPAAEALPSPSDATLASPAPSAAVGSGISPDYNGAMHQEWGSHDVGYGNGACGSTCGACPNVWYAGGKGLFMTKDFRHGFNTSIDDWDSTVVLGNCGCINGGIAGGFEVSVGHTFNCCQNALEVTYWGLFPGQNWRDAYAGDMTGNLNSTLNMGDLDYDDGLGNAGPVQDWYNNSQHHSVSSEYNINSVEINLLGQCCGSGVFGGGCCAQPCGCGLNFAWSAGLRYFQFNERFMFGSDDVDYVWDGSANELWYENEVTNDLLGFQLGGQLDYRFNKCWSVFVNGKAGVYGNHATNQQSVYGSNGYATSNNGGWNGEEYYINSDTYDLAMLAQMDLGVKWQMNCHWALTAGYRVVGVSGVALYADQLPTDFSNYDVISDINTNGSLLLHGGFAGLEFCF